MKTKELKQFLAKSIYEDDERIKELDDEKEKFLATKAQTEKVKALAELDKAESEKKSGWARFWMTTATVVTGVGTIAVELYKARNKNKTNKTILDNQLDIIGSDRQVFDNR